MCKNVDLLRDCLLVVIVLDHNFRLRIGHSTAEKGDAKLVPVLISDPSALESRISVSVEAAARVGVACLLLGFTADHKRIVLTPVSTLCPFDEIN